MINGIYFLGYCLLLYVVFAPLIRDDEGKIHLDSVVVAVTFGLVTSGMLLQAGIISGLPLKTIVLVPLLIIGIWNFRAYRRIAALLGDAGWQVNDKRVERLWRREGLKVPSKQPKKGRLWLNDGSCIRLRPTYRRIMSGPMTLCITGQMTAGLSGHSTSLMSLLVSAWRCGLNESSIRLTL